jgi:PLP dependent protein
VNEVAAALQAVRERIAAAERSFGRRSGEVRLLAVSKTMQASAVRSAYETGQKSFGENYLQEAVEKIGELRALDAEWHFIGPVQSNKTRAIAAHFAWVHSVDRLKIAQRLSAQRDPGLPPLNLCLEVNLGGEASKSGVTADETLDLALAVSALPRLRLRGLMTIPRPETDFEAQRKPFRALRELRDALRAKGLALDTLSMGMTADMEAAIAEGTTLVRIGTAIFGSRT